MNKIVPLFLVLFVGEMIIRHAGGNNINMFAFVAILLFCLIFWKLVLALTQCLLKILVAIFFMEIFK
ncbi:4-hydroxybenzoate octaprenyltransferase [Enterococcus thailandicus]|uniref:hypothetical protein n=1 Tax=Enterococcus thailandicus TaxID=417368 RepID=UPI00244D7FFF|nr:hypothetical protein [Enterococcus thailandicus]GMC02505.1 4-hydroxybenzoate octaprenyltransferase [Enterococcus thailandicus]GMC10031.1 4-hydroxybenzoate octaprenyltransferase [Enterococcus thailandicus]